MQEKSLTIQTQGSSKNQKMPEALQQKIFNFTPQTPIIQQILHRISPQLALVWRKWRDIRKCKRVERASRKFAEECGERRMRWVLFGETESSKAMRDFYADYPSGRC